jgi:hypothetical protein
MPRLQVGIDNYNPGRSPYINWLKAQGLSGQSITINGVDTSGSALFDSGYVDSNYEFVNPLPALATKLSFLIYARPVSLDLNPDLSSLQMKVSWANGAGVTGVTGLSLTNLSVNLTGKYATFNFTGPNTGNSVIYFAVSSASEPPTNIQVYDSSLESDLLAGKTFDPTIAATFSQWGLLRCMNLMFTNGSAAVDYSDFPSLSFMSWSANGITSGERVGLPTSTLIEIANTTRVPIWVCIPHQFTDAAVTSFATNLFNGIDWTIPGMMVMVEYSNEYWNSSFGQYGYANTQAASASWTGGDGQKWGGYRNGQINGIFRSVFGTDSGTKWCGILSTQLVSTDVTNRRITGANYYISNEAPAGTTIPKLFGYLATANYFGPDPSTAISGVGQTLATLAGTLSGTTVSGQQAFNSSMLDQISISAASNSAYNNIAYLQTYWAGQKAIADTNSLKFTMHEGGYGAQCLLPLRDNNSGETEGPLLNQAFANFAASQECGILEGQLACAFIDFGGVYPSKFADVSSHNKYGSWGARQTLSDDSYSYQKLQVFNQGYRPMAVTLTAV